MSCLPPVSGAIAPAVPSERIGLLGLGTLAAEHPRFLAHDTELLAEQTPLRNVSGRRCLVLRP